MTARLKQSPSIVSQILPDCFTEVEAGEKLTGSGSDALILARSAVACREMQCGSLNN